MLIVCNDSFLIKKFFLITSTRFDAQAKYAFIGDHAGQITMLGLDVQGAKLITTFKGHTGITL